MIELWREALRSLPSETFLDLMRAYLGPVRTPYRKHELIEELESFLKKKETADRIVSLLDDSDAACLSAVMVLDGGDRDRLAEFLGGDRAQALARIVNLEERLLIFEAPEPAGTKRPLRVNPLLADELRRFAYEPALVFPPAAPGSPAGADIPAVFPSLDRLDPAAIAAMAAFFLGEDRAPKRKADGELKIPAKAARDFEDSFPSGWDCVQAAGFMEASRIFRFVNGKFSFQRFEAEAFFASAEEAEARAAALVAPLPDGASLVKAASECIPRGIAFSREAVIRFILASPSAREGQPRANRELAARLISGMSRVGILKRLDDGREGYELRPGGTRNEEDAFIHIGSDYHIIVGSRVSPPDLLFLAQCLDLVRLGAALELGLNRKSAARAYRLGSGREATENRLARLSGAPLPQNLAYSLEAWEREHRSVNIASGIVVFGDERLSRFMEHSPAMKEHVLERVASGAYLTDFESVEECEKALQRAGMETPPRLLDSRPGPRPANDFAQRQLFASGASAGGERFRGIDWGKARERPPLDPSKLLSELSDRLKNTDYPKETKEALAERIRLRLIIGAAGLRPDSVRYERSEAGGLDYLGKVKLIEHALREPNWLLDILYRGSGGQPERRTVKPVALNKSPGGLLLECRSEDGSAEDGPVLRIPVEKVSNVKRIRLSLFG